MSLILEQYLDRVMIYANRNEADSADIRDELKSHLLDKAEDLEANGMSAEQALLRAVEDHGDVKTIGYGLRRRFNWIDVRTHGTARGIIAIGPKAVGVVAVGGIACGVFAYGALSFGILTCGVVSIGLLIACGGLSLAPVGFAYGLIAAGLMAVGVISIGVWAIGVISMSLIPGDYWYSINQYISQPTPVHIQYLSSYIRRLQTPFILFWESAIVLMIIKLILSRKELRRIRKADPTLVQ